MTDTLQQHSFQTPQPTQTPPAPPQDKKLEAYRVASAMFNQHPDWVTFFREILGTEGVIRQLFPTPQDMVEFEKTEQYTEIQQMLIKLRERTSPPPESKEPTRVITVRMPKSLHESLRVEAHTRRTSMNKLCISKLLQVIAEGLKSEE